ncbi:hypothetical protein DFH07DRAFT_763673 [Mycena maculata]|uniref:Uncharacterized protein n=1 Tax=Mycena maculata TaxID=230809 RepID=A0AAD7P2I0_9AGAR|nr:hypothetical protein DFH07DRAFT_763673 [Mycena maculata]
MSRECSGFRDQRFNIKEKMLKRNCRSIHQRELALKREISDAAIEAACTVFNIGSLERTIFQSVTRQMVRRTGLTSSTAGSEGTGAAVATRAAENSRQCATTICHVVQTVPKPRMNVTTLNCIVKCDNVGDRSQMGRTQDKAAEKGRDTDGQEVPLLPNLYLPSIDTPFENGLIKSQHISDPLQAFVPVGDNGRRGERSGKNGLMRSQRISKYSDPWQPFVPEGMDGELTKFTTRASVKRIRDSGGLKVTSSRI